MITWEKYQDNKALIKNKKTLLKTTSKGKTKLYKKYKLNPIIMLKSTKYIR